MTGARSNSETRQRYQPGELSRTTPPAAAGAGAVGAAPDGFDAAGVVTAAGSAAGLTATPDLDVPVPMLDETYKQLGERVCKTQALSRSCKF